MGYAKNMVHKKNCDVYFKLTTKDRTTELIRPYLKEKKTWLNKQVGGLVEGVWAN